MFNRILFSALALVELVGAYCALDALRAAQSDDVTTFATGMFFVALACSALFGFVAIIAPAKSN